MMLAKAVLLTRLYERTGVQYPSLLFITGEESSSAFIMHDNLLSVTSKTRNRLPMEMQREDNSVLRFKTCSRS